MHLHCCASDSLVIVFPSRAVSFMNDSSPLHYGELSFKSITNFFFFCWLIDVPLLKDCGSFKVFDQCICLFVLFFFFFALYRYNALGPFHVYKPWRIGFSVQLFRQKHLSPVSCALPPRNELLCFLSFAFTIGKLSLTALVLYSISYWNRLCIRKATLRCGIIRITIGIIQAAVQCWCSRFWKFVLFIGHHVWLSLQSSCVISFMSTSHIMHRHHVISLWDMNQQQCTFFKYRLHC